jgi:hypothetical protein
MKLEVREEINDRVCSTKDSGSSSTHRYVVRDGDETSTGSIEGRLLRRVCISIRGQLKFLPPQLLFLIA